MSDQRKTAIVDIDNTLWQFCDHLYERLRKINKAVPSPEHWNEWDFYEGYFSSEDFMDAINDIHYHQDHDDFMPYPEAKDFLDSLKENGYTIIIASHRLPDFRAQTERWLFRHGLYCDELHLSFQKTKLIDSATCVVVDDSPHVLEKAVENGAIATGLLFSWNKVYSSNGCKLFGNLNDILSYILTNKFIA
jgi:FMN phosphatase YigB (HAD superfamily)